MHQLLLGYQGNTNNHHLEKQGYLLRNEPSPDSSPSIPPVDNEGAAISGNVPLARIAQAYLKTSQREGVPGDRQDSDRQLSNQSLSIPGWRDSGAKSIIQRFGQM
jgi:hypothetical protein